MKPTDWIGFIGVAILLVAFFLNLSNRLHKDSLNLYPDEYYRSGSGLPGFRSHPLSSFCSIGRLLDHCFNRSVSSGNAEKESLTERRCDILYRNNIIHTCNVGGIDAAGMRGNHYQSIGRTFRSCHKRSCRWCPFPAEPKLLLFPSTYKYGDNGERELEVLISDVLTYTIVMFFVIKISLSIERLTVISLSSLSTN